MESSILDIFFKYFSYKNDPKYISNKEIDGFLSKYKDEISYSDFVELRDYFLIKLNAWRIVFKTRESLFKEKEAGDFQKVRVSPVKKKGLIVKPVKPSGLNACREQMVLRRYSPRTVKTYLATLCRAQGWFSREFGISLEQVEPHQVRSFFILLIEKIELSASTVRLYRSAMQFYMRAVGTGEFDLSFLDGMKNSNYLPTIVSRKEINIILDCIKNVKHRTMIGLLYASGLRLSELIKLRVCDMDLDELVIHIRRGKGEKDRVTIFAGSLVAGLEYCMYGKGTLDYVFTTGHDMYAHKKRHISGRTVQKVLENAAKAAGITKKVRPHDLRHSFATHLLESGISIRHIQELLGHKHISTTSIYTRVSRPGLRGIKSPLA